MTGYSVNLHLGVEVSFPEATKIEYKPTNPLIVVSRKKLHIGMLMGQINYGGGEIALDNNYGIRFIRDGSAFVIAELVHYGLDNKPTYQGWVKATASTNKVKDKPKPQAEALDKHISVSEQGDLF